MSAVTLTTPRPVGRVLLEQGLLTQAQIDHALAEQKRSKDHKLLGEMVVELGFCTPEQVIEALAESAGIPFARLGPRLIDPAVIDALPRDFIDKQCGLPLFKVDGVLTVAVHEPSNPFLAEEISHVAGCAVQLVAATAQDIRSLLGTHQPDANVFVLDELVDAAGQALPDAVEAAIDIGNLADVTGGSPVIKLANTIVSAAVGEGASDIHIEPDDGLLRVRYRIDGQLVERLRPPVHIAPALTSRIKIMASLDISERRLPQDGAIHVKLEGRPVDLRVSVLPNRHGEKIVLRIIDNRNVLVRLEQLGFDECTLEQFRRQIGQPHGLLLVTGPTGSGKSTTLYSALAEINAASLNICTVEDPIEFNLPGVNQFQVNEKIGFTFPSTLRSLLRQDPDVIMVGEIRDMETARIAVQAALTGHMVFSTLHTNDAPGAVTRLYNIGVEPYLISAALVGVLAQRLVRRLCSNCREEGPAPPALVHAAQKLGQVVERAHAAPGCSRCRRTGFAGRIGLYEMMVPDDELRDAITAGATLNEVRAHAKRTGMRSLVEDGFDKVRQGVITPEEVLRVTAA